MPESPASPISIRPIVAAETYDLRHRVLWPDQPPAYVQLPEDATGYHYGAFRGGRLVSVVSLFVQGETARFRKFATDPRYQGQGIGTQLLQHIMAEAARHGARRLTCDARLAATALYQRSGMVPHGDVFYKGSVAYVRMEKPL